MILALCAWGHLRLKGQAVREQELTDGVVARERAMRL
jgi:hypothetical protein